MGRKIYIKNNTVGEIKGVGTIRIKTSNGLTRLLTGVLHVMGLRRSIISLGRLDSKGCSCVVRRGLIKVKRDSLMLFLDERVGNLYVLLESTDFRGITKVKRVWKLVGKSVEGIDDEAPITTSSQCEDNHNGK